MNSYCSLPWLQGLSPDKAVNTDLEWEEKYQSVTISPLHTTTPLTMLNPPPLSGGDQLFPASLTRRQSPTLIQMHNPPSQQEKVKSLSLSTVAAWNISEEEVPTLPERHPMDQSAIFVPRADVLQVAHRICNAMERCSAKVVGYDNSKAKASCVSSDGVDFRVRLYRGKGEFSHGIIVDIQRREGFSPSYHFDVIGILDTVEGKMTHAMPCWTFQQIRPNML